MANERLHRTLAVLEELYYHELNVLEQLEYVIENIQAPIQQSIKSTYHSSERQPFPEIASLHRRVQKLLTSRLFQENNKVHTETSNNSSNKKKKNSKVIHPPASPFRTSDKTNSNKMGIMSNEQYWTLFANLALLYQSHLEVMESLHNLLHVLYSAYTKTNKQQCEEFVLEECSEQLNMEEEDEWEYNVCSFLYSKAMEEFMAQHYMYSVHFTSNAAPLIMQLARLWRWSVREVQSNNNNTNIVSNEISSVGNSSAASSRKEENCVEIDLQRVCSSDRQRLVCFASFIDFLYRSFGNSGIPRDSRVHCVHLPEMMQMESSTSESLNKKSNNLKNESKSHRASKGVMAHLDYRTHLPLIPPTYVGFFTFLMLLATPLPSLRFLQHTARTLLENKYVMSEYGREVIASRFLSSVHQWMTGATNEINEFTANDDVHSILSLIDESNMRESWNIDISISISNNNNAQENRKARCSIKSVFDYLSLPHHTRILIHYGHLSLKIKLKRTREERLFFLFSDVLCYVEEQVNGRLMLQGALSLLHIKVNVVADVDNIEMMNCFEIHNSNDNNNNSDTTEAKRLTLFAETAEQRLQWINAINYAIHKLRDSQRKVGKTPNEKVKEQIKQTNYNKNNDNNNEVEKESCILHPKSRLSRQRGQDVQWQRFFHPDEFVKSSNTLASTKQTNEKATTDVIVPLKMFNNKEQLPKTEVNSEESVGKELENTTNTNKNVAHNHKEVDHERMNNDNTPTKVNKEEEEEEEKLIQSHHEVSSHSHSHSHSSWSSYITTHRRIRSNEVGTLLLSQPHLSPSDSPVIDSIAESDRNNNNNNNINDYDTTESRPKIKEGEETNSSSESSESRNTANTKVQGDSSIFTCKVESSEASICNNNNNQDEKAVKTPEMDEEVSEELLESKSHEHSNEINHVVPLSRLLTERFESCVFVHKVNEKANVDKEEEEEEAEEHKRKNNRDEDEEEVDDINSSVHEKESSTQTFASCEINIPSSEVQDDERELVLHSGIRSNDNKNNDETSESLE